MVFRNGLAPLVTDRFVEVRIERLAFGFDRLETVVSQKVVELLQHHGHAGVNRRVFAFSLCGRETELEVVDDRDQALKQRAVRVLDRFLFFALTTLFVIFEVGLTAQREIAEAVEVSLETRQLVLLLWLPGDVGSVCHTMFFFVTHWNFLHVLRITIRVMSSFCGVVPTNARRSSITRLIIAAAPFIALACTDLIMRSGPNSKPFASSASVTPSV